jgi:hypothetical protein
LATRTLSTTNIPSAGVSPSHGAIGGIVGGILGGMALGLCLFRFRRRFRPAVYASRRRPGILTENEPNVQMRDNVIDGLEDNPRREERASGRLGVEERVSGRVRRDTIDP